MKNNNVGCGGLLFCFAVVLLFAFMALLINAGLFLNPNERFF